MMSTLTRNVMMVCSLAVLCAVLVGCSSNDDKDSRQNRSLISVLGTPYSSTPHGTYRVR